MTNSERSDNLLRSIIDATVDGILFLEPVFDKKNQLIDFKIIIINDELCKLTKEKQDSLVNKNIGDSAISSLYKELKIVIKQVYNSNKAISAEFEWQLLCKKLNFNYHICKINNGILLTLSNITENKQLEKQLSYTANHDVLTGLANRNLFQDRLYRAAIHANRRNEKVVVMFLDLDGFKAINDSSGHDIGDLLLTEVANRLNNCAREVDTVSRLGGDEFTIIMENISEELDAALMARRIIRNIKQPYFIDGKELSITISIGIAIGSSPLIDIKTLIKQADLALYKAKESGKNNFKYFTEELNINTDRKKVLINSLSPSAIDEQFDVLYQPLVNVADNKLRGAELFLRWNHPYLGIINPTEFLPVLEELDLMSQVGNNVINTGCAQYSAWLRDGSISQDSLISFNVSAHQLIKNPICDLLKEVIEKYKVDSSKLVFEITEIMLGINNDKLKKSIFELKDLGVQISLDDFGTGSSSLSQLKKFPIDEVKIDCRFISALPDNADDLEITSSIIALCHKLGKRVVAEGVENIDTLDYLKLQGCDIYQGYYFSKPISAEKFIFKGSAACPDS